MGRMFARSVMFLGAVGLFSIGLKPTGKVGSSFAPNLEARHRGCSVDSLEGDYVWRFNRLSVTSGIHRDALGVMSFDGAGNISAVVTFNDDGVSTLRVPRTGTYAVDADCTGTLILDGVNYCLNGQLKTGNLWTGQNRQIPGRPRPVSSTSSRPPCASLAAPSCASSEARI